MTNLIIQIEDDFFGLRAFEEKTGKTTHLQPVYPGDRITSQCIRMMRAPAHSHSYYQTTNGGRSVLC